jgi:hypothetical protein
MAIDVTVTEQCGRCKRKEQVTIKSDQVEAFEKKDEERKEYEQSVIEFVESRQEADRHKLPDLVVIFKGKVQMISQVCDAHCAKTVQNGIEALFREHKPRKPRTKKASPGNGQDAKDAGGKDDKKAAKGGKAKDDKKTATPPAG